RRVLGECPVASAQHSTLHFLTRSSGLKVFRPIFWPGIGQRAQNLQRGNPQTAAAVSSSIMAGVTPRETIRASALVNFGRRGCPTSPAIGSLADPSSSKLTFVGSGVLGRPRGAWRRDGQKLLSLS